jgi:hypothetical protein
MKREKVETTLRAVVTTKALLAWDTKFEERAWSAIEAVQQKHAYQQRRATFGR